MHHLPPLFLRRLKMWPICRGETAHLPEKKHLITIEETSRWTLFGLSWFCDLSGDLTQALFCVPPLIHTRSKCLRCLLILSSLTISLLFHDENWSTRKRPSTHSCSFVVLNLTWLFTSAAVATIDGRYLTISLFLVCSGGENATRIWKRLWQQDFYYAPPLFIYMW